MKPIPPWIWMFSTATWKYVSEAYAFTSGASTGISAGCRQADREASLDACPSTAEVIRDREELAEQIRALGELVEMAASYGHDVTRPAATAREAIQWLYLAYLAAVKEQNCAAMSLGRTLTFLDIYLERDLREGGSPRWRRKS